jgi:cell division protein FtsB
MIAKNKKIKKKSRFKKIIFWVFATFFLIAVGGFLIISNLKIKQKRAEMAEKIESLKQQIQLLSERNQQLKEGIFQAESDDFWKAKLYEQGYKEPGEEVVVIVPPEKKEQIQETEQDKSFLNRMIEGAKKILSF